MSVLYGFKKHLQKKFPSQIIIDSTQFCNLECIHCPHPNFKNSNAYSGSHLDIELHNKMIDEVGSDGYGFCQYVRYTANGETLLHPKIDEMIEYAAKYSKTKINITTNGQILTEKRVKKLLDAGVNVFDISLDAFKEETYKKIRVKGDLAKTRENVIRLINQINVGSYDAKLVVSFVEQDLNSSEVGQFNSFWSDAGADFVIIRRLHSAGGAKNSIKDQIIDEFSSQKRKPCLYPWERLTLTPEGNLSYCPTDWVNKSHFVKFSQTTVKEAWNSLFMKELREAHLTNEYTEFEFCKQCPDWVHTRWPHESKSYSDMMMSDVPSDLLE